MAITFECSRCGQSLEAEDEHAGKEAECPTCHAMVGIPQATPERDEQMPVLARCVVCGALRGYSREKVGKDVECRKCGGLFRLTDSPRSLQCPECRAEVDERNTRCPSCGADIPSEFDRRIREEQRRELEILARNSELARLHAQAVRETASQVICARCGSTHIMAGRRGFGGAAGLLGALCVGPIGLLAGCIGSGTMEITCLRCGFRWSPSSLVAWATRIAAARRK